MLFFCPFERNFKWAFFVVKITNNHTEKTQLLLCILTNIQNTKNFFAIWFIFALSKPLPLEGQNSSRTLKTEYQETKYISFGKSNDKKYAMTSQERAIKLVCKYQVVPNKAKKTEMIMILPFSYGSSVKKPSQPIKTALERKRGESPVEQSKLL